MRINFLGYLDPFVYEGGGELALRAVIEHGRQRGHEVRVVARRNGKWSRIVPPRMEPLPPADLYILADLFNCPEDNAPIDVELLQRIASREPFLHWENAWADICVPPYIPCELNPQPCPDSCRAPLSRWLYQQALACIFVSPLHARVAARLLGEGIIRRTIIARPLVDSTVFYNRRERRDIDYLCAGTIADYKGYQNVRRLLAGEKVLFIGRNLTGERLFGQHIEHVPHTEMARYYNRAKVFVHLPEWIEPQGRTVVEAALCGCGLMTNEKVGAMSFDFPPSDPGAIAAAPYLLWEEIESVAMEAGIAPARRRKTG